MRLTKKQRIPFYRRATTGEIVSLAVAFLALVPSIIASFKPSGSENRMRALALALYSGGSSDWRVATERTETDWTQAVALLLAVVALSYNFYIRYRRGREDDEKLSMAENHEGLSAVLLVFQTMLEGRANQKLNKPAAVRVTLWAPEYRKQGSSVANLEQIVDYVGSPATRGRGRLHPISTGVIGRCFRTGEPVSLTRPPEMEDQDWVQALVEEYGYTREEAESKLQKRAEFVAYPILLPDATPLAVLYADADQAHAFAEAEDILRAADIGLGAYIAERYSENG